MEPESRELLNHYRYLLDMAGAMLTQAHTTLDRVLDKLPSGSPQQVVVPPIAPRNGSVPRSPAGEDLVQSLLDTEDPSIGGLGPFASKPFDERPTEAVAPTQEGDGG